MKEIKRQAASDAGGGIDLNDPKLIEACKKYGKISDTADYYTLGNFVG